MINIRTVKIALLPSTTHFLAVSFSRMCAPRLLFLQSFVSGFRYSLGFPPWTFPCCRLLRNIYGSGYLNALSSLAEQSNQLRDMVNQSLFDDFYANNVQRSGLCVWFHLVVARLDWFESKLRKINKTKDVWVRIFLRGEKIKKIFCIKGNNIQILRALYFLLIGEAKGW